MKMKKSLLVCALVVALSVSVFSGCGDSSSPASSTAPGSEPAQSGDSAAPEAASTEMETILVWSDNAHEKDLRVQQIEAFNNGTGKDLGIEIEYTVYGSNFWDTIQIAAKAGDAPDLYRADTKWLNDFVEAGYVVPLDGMPGGQEMIARYDGLLVKQYHIFNDQVYTLPYNLTTYKFVINTDLFEAAGIDIPTAWTWDDVREAARQITESSGGDAYGFGLSLSDLWTLSSYLTMPAGTNVGHYGYNYDTRQFEFAALAPLASSVYDIIQDGSVFPGFEGLDGDGVRAQFSEGRIGILGAASFDAAVYNEQFPAKCNWAVVPEPAFESSGSPYKEFVQPTQLLVIGEKAMEHPQKAMTVFEYFYSDECAAEMYEQGLYVPIRNEAIALATKEPDAKGFAEFADVPDKFVMSPMPDTMISVEGAAYREVLVNFFAGTAGDDALAVLQECDERYNRALEELTDEQLDLFSLPEGTSVLRGN